MKRNWKTWIAVLTCFMLLICAAGCQSQENSGKEKETYPSVEVDAEAVTLTIASAKHDAVVLTAEDLAKLPQVTRDYSGRGKQAGNERVFVTQTGVDLVELLKTYGFETEGANLYIVCSDNYVREYALEDLQGLYTFKDNATNEKTEVEPMIAIRDASELEYPCPFQIFYGQAGYDTAKSMDFNMQGWAVNVQYMWLSY